MIKIRKGYSQDIGTLIDIWLRASVQAHHFIPEKYWMQNVSAMETEYLPASEVYVAEERKRIMGFVALMGNRIAAIFVSPGQQRKGTGSLLIRYVKELRSELELNVYQLNTAGVRFYQSEGFWITSETTDQPTQEKEFEMKWKKE